MNEIVHKAYSQTFLHLDNLLIHWENLYCAFSKEDT